MSATTTGTRKPRKEPRRPQPTPDDFGGDGGSDDDDDNNNDDESKKSETQENQKRQLAPAYCRRNKTFIRNCKRVKINGWQGRVPVEHQVTKDLSDEEIEAQLAFCCQICHCLPEKQALIPKLDQYCIGDVYDGLWHRRCCHDLTQDIFDESWLPPFEHAQTALAVRLSDDDQFGGQNENDPSITAIGTKTLKRQSRGELYTKYNSYKNQESEYHNDGGKPRHEDVLQTNSDYKMNMQWFNKVVANANTSGRKAVVLDAFGGIGAGLVCLKRLGMAIQKVIHVEHDKVANHVYKYNHDSNYNHELPQDDIEHVYDYDDWDDFAKNIDSVLEQHGPIDIIIGGPPCVDFTPINANRQGVDGKQGRFMKEFGELVCYINQKRIETGHSNVWYLAENTKLSDDQEKPLPEGDLAKIKEAFCVDWDLEFDSRIVSPIRRKRTYISNIPLTIKDSDVSKAPPRTCLEDGFDVPSVAYEKNTWAKIQGLMASPGRLDDDRMFVYRKIPRRDGKKIYEGRPLSVLERERLMGLKEGYVSKPVELLFETLLQDGLERNCTDPRNNWKYRLDAKYHTFCGDYHNFGGEFGCPFRFDENEPQLTLKLAPPLTTATPQFYTAEGYAKRLLGNTFSVPTVEMLLRPLEPLFARRNYPMAGYTFAWQGNDDDLI